MDSFFVVCIVLANGMFIGAYAVTQFGFIFEKRENAVLKMKIRAMELAMDYQKNFGGTYNDAFEIISNSLATQNNK